MGMLENIAKEAISDNIVHYANEFNAEISNVQLAVTINKRKALYCVFVDYEPKQTITYEDIVVNTKNFFKQNMLAPLETTTEDYFVSMVNSLCDINKISIEDSIIFLTKNIKTKKDLNVALCTDKGFRKDYTFDEAINN